ncbi:ribbon-helix-helix protein, CopG family [Bombella mellum]|nr:ribbon-helix-helix protein, CopG family [Bombella mellum]
MLTGRVPASLIKALEEWAARHDITRSEAIRRLIQRGLEAEERG